MSYKLVTTDGYYVDDLFESIDDAVNFAFSVLNPEEVTYLVKKRDQTVAIVHENEIFTRVAKKISPRDKQHHLDCV